MTYRNKRAISPRSGSEVRLRAEIYMPDIKVQEQNWYSLSHRALFFIPKLLRLSGLHGVSAAEIIQYSKKLDRRYWLGPPAVRTILTSQPATFKKVEAARRAFNSIEIEAADKGTRLEDMDIIACVLIVQGLDAVMHYISLTDLELSKKIRLSVGIIANARRGGRVFLSAGVAIIDEISVRIEMFPRPMQTVDNSTKEMPDLVDKYRNKAYKDILSSTTTGHLVIHKKSTKDDMSAIDHADLLLPINKPKLFEETW